MGRSMPWLLVVGMVGCTDGGPAGPVCTEALGQICPVAGSGDRGFNGDGPALDTWLFLPSAVAFDPDGRLLVVDFNNMVIRRRDDDGTLPAIAGTGVHAYAEDGVDAQSTGLENPIDVAAAPDGTLYIMELHGARVLRVDPAGWLTVYAGHAASPGYEGYDGDGGPARDASMTQSVGLTLGDDGTLFIADTLNHAIRMVTPDGIMGTLAGNGERGFVDGIGAQARLDTPHHLAWHAGAVYVGDAGNHAVRRIDVATGEVTTVAGTGEPGFSGDGGPAVAARLREVQGVSVAQDGRLFIADTGNHVIRTVGTDGVITTIAGQPERAGGDGDFGPAADAFLSRPQEAVVHGGDVYVVDTLNDRVRCIYGAAAAR